MQIKRNVGTKVPETRKKGGMVKSSAQTSVIKGAQAPGSREGSVIKGPKAKGSREGSVIKAKKGGWIQDAIKKPGALRKSLGCLLYTSPSPRDGLLSRMPSSA